MKVYYFLWKFISLVYESLSISLKVYTCIFFIYRSVPRGGIWERGIERSDEDRVMILKNYPSIVSVRSLENQISTHYSYMWIYESLENQISTHYSYMWIYESLENQISTLYSYMWIYESLENQLSTLYSYMWIYESLENQISTLYSYMWIYESLENQISTLYSYIWIYESLENQISTLYSYMWIYERCMGLKKSLKKASVITILRLLEYIFILHCKYHLPINFHVCQVRHCEFTWFKDLWHHFTEPFTQNIKLRTFSRSS